MPLHQGPELYNIYHCKHWVHIHDLLIKMRLSPPVIWCGHRPSAASSSCVSSSGSSSAKGTGDSAVSQTLSVQNCNKTIQRKFMTAMMTSQISAPTAASLHASNMMNQSVNVLNHAKRKNVELWSLWSDDKTRDLPSSSGRNRNHAEHS